MLTIFTPEDAIPADHPIRQVKVIVDRMLGRLSPTFSAMYSEVGRRSLPPEHLLKASVLMALFSVPSERRFCERLQYDLLFKWFLDLNIGDPAFDQSTFSKNRERLLKHDVAERFFTEVLGEIERLKLRSDDHFTVDGTLLEAWASLKSLQPRPKDGTPPQPPAGGGRNPSVDWKGQKRSNTTHVSTTDPDARLATKGKHQTTKLCFTGHLLTENRNGLIVGVTLTQSTGTAEQEAALALLGALPEGPRLTVGADKGYDTADFVQACRAMNITPHVAAKDKGSALDGRTTRHAGYATSQRRRKLVEEVFGWMKTVALSRKLRYIGQAKNRFWFTLLAASYNIVRLTNLAKANA
jgi:transposase